MQDTWDITLQNLTVGYGKTIVLQDITATLPAGKITVILGGSGCGKSTLLRHITGLAKPMSGTIAIGGQDLFLADRALFRSIRRRMGVLFQDGALLGSMTLAENVALPLTEHLPISAAEARTEALRVLAMVGLASEADRFPNQLSGGMRKRAGLARAIIHNPRILLCDEPTSGLDPITAARMDALLIALHREFPSMTIVSVSHDLASLKAIADYVLVLRDGKSQFCGTVTDLYATTDPYLRQFLSRESDEDLQDFSASMQEHVAILMRRSFES